MMKIFLLFLWLLLPQTIMAQVKTVVVNMKDGSTTMFRLADEPEITYTSNNLVIKTTIKEASVPVANIENVTFEEHSVATTINQTTITDNRILFRQLPVNAVVRVLTVNGKTFCTKTAGKAGDVTFDFSELPKGVLIINTPTVTFKVNN